MTRGARALVLAWAAVGVSASACALMLQLLGPPGPPAKRLAAAAPPDTRPPVQRFAARFDRADRRPRVALLVDGIGLDRADTEAALASLPTAVDVAFSAYATSEERAVDEAASRTRGRECLVSVPMEPQGYPLVDEGDHALLSGAPADRNAADLAWALSRSGDCVGATGASDGMAGERFARSGATFRTMLDSIAQRGLVYVSPLPQQKLQDWPRAEPQTAAADAPAADAPSADAPSADAPAADAPAASELGARTGTAPARAVDVVIDASPTPGASPDAATIDRNLAALERLALLHGGALGLAGPPRPVTIERIRLWAGGLAARGIALAPLTALLAPDISPAAPLAPLAAAPSPSPGVPAATQASAHE